MARRLTGGALRGVPFELIVRPVQVTPEGRAITVFVVHLQIVGSDLLALQSKVRDQLKIELDQARQVAQASATYQRMLTGAGGIEPVEGLEDDDDLLDIDPPGPGGPPPVDPDPAELFPDEIQVNEFIRLMRGARSRKELAAVGKAVKSAEEKLTAVGRETLRTEYSRVENLLPATSA